MHGEVCLPNPYPNANTLFVYHEELVVCEGHLFDPPLDYTGKSSSGKCSEVWVQNPSPLLSAGQDVGEAISCLKAVGESLLPFSDR